MKFDVVTFGSALVDVFVDTDVAERGKFICYSVGSKIILKNLRYDVGGGGTNTAVAFARLGLKTGCISKFGNDVNGEKILSLLKEEKIKFLGKIEKGKITGSSIILDSKENNRTILSYKAISDDVLFKDVAKFKTKWFYLSSLLGESFKTQKKLVEILHKKKTKIAFNPSDYLIKKLGKKGLIKILKLCEVLILNKEEAEMLVKEKDLLKELYSLGPKIVVITNKNNLIRAYDGKKRYFLKPHNIKVVERTGAGDAFASGFVAGLIVGKNVKKSLELGLRESEVVVRHIGAKNNLLKMKLK